MPLTRVTSIEALSGLGLTPSTIAILPVAATEAHGPHLPVTTDCDIAEGHLDAFGSHLSSAIDAVVLPIQRIGASREHLWAPGTQSREEADLFADWFAIAQTLARAGGRRLVVVSSHGGNTAVVDSLILTARAELEMLAVGTAWMRFAQFEKFYTHDERKYGIHGGAIETALMLHFAPHLVDMAKAENFPSFFAAIESEMTHLSATGRHRFGWLSSDLNPQGVAGDATIATAEQGALLADQIHAGFAQLLDDVARFDLSWLR
ncbi:creatininase family protein [Pelagibacterium mangrovi]|uniref:creatininase family protein n=1 Tax=Pelagibacterium mangrovi TaxID=3119828 RepID=UPI002FCA678B